ncbi:hypothetical protein JV173_00645 [Acholeplasma equirhinis]|uniref:hypothetical protein n=1 Tax=Acholeplasma equirhinis TaxID=555393 RepID=UPI00197AF70A|nr:hypothetical protein [Acholeplasma equirhinis]MBN3490012.1 hypothetical protein [Acholeplasma equirhinis]
MFRKLGILILSLILTLSTAIGVYAWMTKPTAGIDLNVRTSELFSASSEIKIGNTSINSLHSYYNAADYTINISAANITANTTSGVMPITIAVAIDAYKNIKVRIKIVEYWTNNSNVSITRPNVFTWNYHSSYNDGVDSEGYFYYSEMIVKDTSDIVNVIDSANVNTTNIPAGSTVRLSVIVSALQGNREDIWENENHKIKSFTLGQNANNQTVNVIFNGVANSVYGRGVYLEFKNVSNKIGFLWHSRGGITRQLSLPQGTYNVSINLVNHLDFTVTRNGNVITVNIQYGDPGEWGYEDVLFAPSMIAVWETGVTYPSGAIVYYRDEDGNGVNAGYYSAIQSNTNSHPDSAAWNWRKISPFYQSGTVYPPGTIVFYQGAFYISKATNSVAPTELWAWERLDRAFNGGKTYKLYDIVFHKYGEETRWFMATGNVSTGQTEPRDYQAFRQLGFNYSAFNKQKYRAGEYVKHNDAFYVANIDNTYADPAANTTQVWRKLGLVWGSNQVSYPQNTIVSYNNNYYIATSTISQWGSTPGSGSWQLITHRGDWLNTTTNYNRYQSVIYGGNRYFWNQTGSAPVGQAPDVTVGWWLIGEAWHYKNTYAQHALVFHNGDYWALRSGTSTNQEPGVSGAWQLLSDFWALTGTYFNNQYTRSVINYNGSYFMWTGANNSNSTTAPGTAINGWKELTEVWKWYNNYDVGEKVIYDGAFWEALKVPYENGEAIVPGSDFTYWKEYPIIWDPNRT